MPQPLMLHFVRSMRVLAAAVLAVCVCGASLAHAAKLDETACTALKAERARLATEALKSDMAKGPDWAKSNLSPDRLREIEQLIGLEESIAFRCPVPKPPPVPAEAKAGDGGKKRTGTAANKLDGGTDGQGADAAAAPVSKKSAAGPIGGNDKAAGTASKDAPVTSTTKPAAKKSASKDSGVAGQAKSATQTKPAAKQSSAGQKPSNAGDGQKPSAPSQKTKAKVTDAYVPLPPASGTGNPAAGPLPPAANAAPAGQALPPPSAAPALSP